MPKIRANLMLIRGYVININREEQIDYMAQQCKTLIHDYAGYVISAKKKTALAFSVGATSIFISQQISFHFIYYTSLLLHM